MQQDQESWSFLRYFTSMPLFKHLVERQVLENDHLELLVFINRIQEIHNNCREKDRDPGKSIRFVSHSLLQLSPVTDRSGWLTATRSTR